MDAALAQTSTLRFPYTETKPGEADEIFLPPNPEKIGTLDANFMRVHCYLQPDVVRSLLERWPKPRIAPRAVWNSY